MPADTPNVKLDRYEGPLDLLLQLIRKAELDISEIAVAKVTDQYLSHVEILSKTPGGIDIDDAGEFLVLAATLIELKSRWIAANDGADGTSADLSKDDDGSERNPAAALIQSLLAYTAYRDAADALDEAREHWAQRYPSGKAHTDSGALKDVIGDDVDLDDLGLHDLAEAFKNIFQSVHLDRMGEHEVTVDETPIELHAADIVDLLERELGPAQEAPSDESPEDKDARQLKLPTFALAAVFAGRKRGEMIGLFLALLELVRQHRVGFRHDAPGPESKGLLLFLKPGEKPEVEMPEEEDAGGVHAEEA